MTKIKSTKFVIIIPARYSSSRLPGKPLRLINKKPLIYLTWKNITKLVQLIGRATGHKNYVDKMNIITTKEIYDKVNDMTNKFVDLRRHNIENNLENAVEYRSLSFIVDPYNLLSFKLFSFLWVK